MTENDRKSVEEAINAVARLALFVVDELEPLSEAVLEADLEEMYELLVTIERKARSWRPGPKET